MRSAATLVGNGHPLDKIELLVLGGTWASYPHAYQEAFVRDLFYAANTFYARGAAKRPRRSLAEEQAENEQSLVKIIGLTLETRPDTINADELRRLRRYGCTRVQLGLQHTDDVILKKVNRGCTAADAIRALRLLKDTCYKARLFLVSFCFRIASQRIRPLRARWTYISCRTCLAPVRRLMMSCLTA